MSTGLVKLIQLLETYRGHDQALSLIGYSLKMCSGIKSNKNPEFSASLDKLSSEISNARVILRLVDDFSMLGYTITYGLGKQVLFKGVFLS